MCEANGVHFLFGLAKNDRLIYEIAGELAQAEAKSRRTGKPARSFKDFMWTTQLSAQYPRYDADAPIAALTAVGSEDRLRSIDRFVMAITAAKALARHVSSHEPV